MATGNSRIKALLEFLKASGVDLTPERVRAAAQFARRSGEAADLAYRAMRAYPIRPDITDRAARCAAGDPNVIRYEYGDGHVRYELKFTPEQSDALVENYLKVQHDPRFPRSEAEMFVRTLGNWADSQDHFEAAIPEGQKDRRRVLEAIAGKLMDLDQLLGDLDSAALGYWYANVVDALAKQGGLVSEADNQLVSMLDAPLRAMAEAGEARQQLRGSLSAIVGATQDAATTLPVHERAANDWRLRMALAVERLVIDHAIPFEVTETGFAATALRAVFDLAGVEVDRVSYWLKKAASHPESYGKLVERLRSGE